MLSSSTDTATETTTVTFTCTLHLTVEPGQTPLEALTDHVEHWGPEAIAEGFTFVGDTPDT